MEIVTVSFKHGLIPFHFRLTSQGADTYLVIWKQKFEHAWEGRVTPALRGEDGEINAGTLGEIRKRVASGKAALLTDVKKHPFEEGLVFGTLGSNRLPTSAIRAGFWLSPVGEPLGLHLLIYDNGLWPYGLGPAVPGAVTLAVLPDEVAGLAEQVRLLATMLHEQGFSGLAQVGIDVNPETGELCFIGVEAGWPFLHTHAFVSELENFSDLISMDPKATPRFTEGRRFVTVVPVSVPPWPTPGRAPQQDVTGLTPQFAAKFFWHDVQVQDGTKLVTAGLDGLLGVARGAAHTPELARSTAIELAGRLGVREKQFRPDAGSQVPMVLAQLERQFNVYL